VISSRPLNVADLQRLAKRRLPRILYDYIEGGVDDEHAVARNAASYGRYRLIPRYLRDCSASSQATRLFGRTYNSPFGLAPTGTVGLFRRGGDLMLAGAAAAANVPYIMSGASNSTLEEAAKIAPEQCWYQLYPAQQKSITQDLVRRSQDAGIGVLVVTVDVPVNPKRERNLRNGFSHRMRLTPSLILDGLAHPSWLLDYLRHGGTPVFENWVKYGRPGSSPIELIDFFSSQSPCTQTWEDILEIRNLWSGPLLIKGLLHPLDAKRAIECGVDGIIVSNHGGRQLDRSPSPLEMIPAIRAMTGPDLPLLIDGGVQRGSDIATALCLGADFVLIGRAAVYGVAAAGEAGVRNVIDILAQELKIVMTQMGCADASELSGDLVMDSGSTYTKSH
jgi:(S)-mandelate dehydrogenase